LAWFIECCGRALERSERELDTIGAKIRFWQAKGPMSLNQRLAKVMAGVWP
jgi:hypothetical protein